MKTLVVGPIVSGLGLCAIVLVMSSLGLGHPNCEPSTAGYAEYFVTLFGCGAGAFLGAGVLVGTATYVINKMA